MRVGQLTLLGRNYGHNFGAVLQAYALHHVLASEGHQVELIDYVPTPFTLSHPLRSFYRFTKKIILITNSKGPIYVLRRFPAWLLEKFTPEFHERIKCARAPSPHRLLHAVHVLPVEVPVVRDNACEWNPLLRSLPHQNLNSSCFVLKSG